MKTPHGINAANMRLKFVFDHVLAIRRILGANADEIHSLQESISKARKRVRDEIKPHTDAIEAAMPTIAQWYRLNLDRYGRGRTIELPVGKLSAHISSHYKVEITGNKADVIERVAKKGAKYVIVTLTLDHDAIVADRLDFRSFKGLKISLKDTLKAEPFAFDPDEDEKKLLAKDFREWRNPRLKPEGRKANPPSA